MIKFFTIFLVIFSITIPTIDAVPLSDMTGLKDMFPVNTDGRSFTIETTGNFQISNFNFDKNEKSITLKINSTVENNILEIVIPKSLISGDFRYYLDDKEIFPKYSQGKNSLFLTIEFVGVGDHKIKLQGTTYLEIFNVEKKVDYEIINATISKLESNPSTNSLIFSLNNTNKTAGQLSIKLSDDVIIPFENNKFIVIVDGIESDYLIENNILYIQFNSNNEKIIITGTYVVPEFYEIAPLVLATSLIGLVALRKYKKLFI